DGDVAAQAGVEEQIPPWMMVVVVDVHAIAFPLPVAAVVDIVRSDHPVGVVIQEDVASAIVNAARDENFAHVLVMTVRISAARTNAGFIILPATIIIAVVLVPALVFAVIVIPAIIVMFVPPFVLAVVMTVVTIVLRCRRYQSACQCHEYETRSEEHTSELQSLAYLVCRLLLEKKKK